jgi:peptidyl-prolyl cis-trans isomerase D
LPALVGVNLGAQGYAVVRINKIVPRPTPVAEAVKQDRGQYAQWWTAAENEAYYGLLKDRFKAEFMVAQPPRSIADAALAASR